MHLKSDAISLVCFTRQTFQVIVGVEFHLQGNDLKYFLEFKVNPASFLRPVPPFYDSIQHLIQKDFLWKRTCFEFFLQGAGPSYVELNFSPHGDGAWKAYSFDAPRVPAKVLWIDETHCVAESTSQGSESGWIWNVSGKLGKFHLPHQNKCSVGVSAILETPSEISYWALTHKGEHPDFHDPRCFKLEIS